jgi:cholest-4-en-3-one 26-monooxygenase
VTGAVDLTDPATFVDGPPHAFLAELRREQPVWQHPAAEYLPPFWVVTRYEDVHDVLLRPSTFINAKGITIEPNEPTNAGDDEGERGQHALSYTDPPEHRPLRQLLARHFTPARIRTLHALVETHAARLVSEFVAVGGGDFITAVAVPYPLRVLAAVLNLPVDTEAALFEFVDTMNPVPFLVAVHALAEERRRNPGDDLISAMVAGDGLAPERLGGVLIQLAVAGNETTRAASGSGMRLLAEHDEQRKALIAEPGLAGSVVEEVLRFRPPVHYLRRTVAEATTIGTQPVDPGEIVYLSIASANRDESVIFDGDSFDVIRSADRSHLSLGVGEHYCLGAALTRLELRCLFTEVAATMPDFRLTGAPTQAPSALFDGLAHLPLA